MGDMGDIFREMRIHKAEHKAKNMEMNLGYLNDNNIDYEVHNHGYQLNFETSFGIVAFYPSTNRWVFNTKTFYGTAENLIGWIKNKEV